MNGEIWVLIGVILYQGILIWFLKADHAKEQERILNRLMARDYAQYVQGEVIRKTSDEKVPQPPPEEYRIPV